MIVMPANATGMFFHCLARETGKLGHLYSPGAQRGPWPWFPYALDNGAFSCWNPVENTFDEIKWQQTEHAWKSLLFWASVAASKPRWAIVPDRPGKAEETFQKWSAYAGIVQQNGIALALAAQDGMTPEAVRALNPKPDVIAVGGSTEWKWQTVAQWAAEFPRVHLLRCNSPERLRELEKMGVESCDGTGWSRGDRKQTEGLETWARGSVPTTMPLWPHVCRGERKAKRQLPGMPTQLTFA